MVLMEWRFIVKDVFFGEPLPFWTACGLYKWSHSLVEQIIVLIHIDYVENYSLKEEKCQKKLRRIF